MFGWYRLWLALLVLVFHLAKPLAVSAGAVAVYSFYVLSGYLITRVVAERYHDGVSGWGRFAFNRVLRLYPAYWAVLIFSLVLIAIAPEVTQRVNRAIQQPQTLVDWFEVITIFGLLRDDIRPVPPAWSVNIELIYYLAISIALGRTKSTTLAWFITSLVLFVGILVTNQERTLQYIYFSYIGPSVCFAAGAMVYHFAKDIPARPIDALAGVLAVTAVAYVRNLPAPNAPLALVLAMTIPAAAYATWALAALRTDNVRARRADTIAGDIAYPVFLAHWPIAGERPVNPPLRPGAGPS